MEENIHHEELVSGLSEQLNQILEKSDQAVYVYLDDEHKNCNKKFADLLGYKSVKEWVEIDAPLADVVEEDQGKVITAYMNTMEKLIASQVEVSMRNVKTGKLVKTKMILVPIAFRGHLFSLQFISRV
jgi:carbohydrate-binding DOMON domain-containing protein